MQAVAPSLARAVDSVAVPDAVLTSQEPAVQAEPPLGGQYLEEWRLEECNTILEEWMITQTQTQTPLTSSHCPNPDYHKSRILVLEQKVTYVLASSFHIHIAVSWC